MTITGFQAKLGKGKPSRLNYKFIRGQCSRRIVRRESQAPQTGAFNCTCRWLFGATANWKPKTPWKKGARYDTTLQNVQKSTNWISNIKIEQILLYTIFLYLVKYDNTQISNIIYHKFQIIKVILQVR